MSASFYQSTWYHIPEDSIFIFTILKSQTFWHGHNELKKLPTSFVWLCLSVCLSMCLNTIEEIFLKSVIKVYMHFCVYVKYNSLNMSEQEMLNIKVREKQETHFMPMHIFHKSENFHIITRRLNNIPKSIILCYFFLWLLNLCFPMKI